MIGAPMITITRLIEIVRVVRIMRDVGNQHNGHVKSEKSPCFLQSSILLLC